jgi:predicted MFS family arabinose efflux permease
VSIALAAAGALIAARSLTRILPSGTARAAPGLPAIVAASFFLNFGYYAASSFVALALVGVRGTTVLVAGVAITAATIAWTFGVWANTVLLDRYSRRALVIASSAGLALAVAAFASSLYGGPLAIAFAAWTAGGFCMGIAFNTLTLNTMDAAGTGSAGQALAGRNLTANLGTAVGTGIAGSAVALTQAAGFGLRLGLLVAYCMAAVTGLVTAALGARASAHRDLSAAGGESP